MLDPTITRCLGRNDDRTLCPQSYWCQRHLAIRTDYKIDDLPPVGMHLCSKEDSFIGVNDDQS